MGEWGAGGWAACVRALLGLLAGNVKRQGWWAGLTGETWAALFLSKKKKLGLGCCSDFSGSSGTVTCNPKLYSGFLGSGFSGSEFGFQVICPPIYSAISMLLAKDQMIGQSILITGILFLKFSFFFLKKDNYHTEMIQCQQPLQP